MVEVEGGVGVRVKVAGLGEGVVGGYEDVGGGVGEAGGGKLGFGVGFEGGGLGVEGVVGKGFDVCGESDWGGRWGWRRCSTVYYVVELEFLLV